MGIPGGVGSRLIVLIDVGLCFGQLGIDLAFDEVPRVVSLTGNWDQFSGPTPAWTPDLLCDACVTVYRVSLGTLGLILGVSLVRRSLSFSSKSWQGLWWLGGLGSIGRVQRHEVALYTRIAPAGCATRAHVRVSMRSHLHVVRPGNWYRFPERNLWDTIPS
ncbi:hypothetical protein WN48_02900 [Eufriesea mexicana]|nr:hypothetical protein WN48_02900 [Eufriesea mexicana]